jgi:hypothetical protein
MRNGPRKKVGASTYSSSPAMKAPHLQRGLALVEPVARKPSGRDVLLPIAKDRP